MATLIADILRTADQARGIATLSFLRHSLHQGLPACVHLQWQKKRKAASSDWQDGAAELGTHGDGATADEQLASSLASAALTHSEGRDIATGGEDHLHKALLVSHKRT